MADSDPQWNFKPMGNATVPYRSVHTSSIPISNHHVRPIYVNGMKGVVRMEVQAALERRAIHYNLELYLFAMNALDHTLGRIFDLYYGKTRCAPHDEQIKHFIEVTVVDLMQMVGTELTEAYQRIGAIAADALWQEDMRGFFDRLLGR